MQSKFLTRPDACRSTMIWGLYALALVVAPLVFTQSASLSLLAQMGTMIIFALSFNMLLGQGGMLSFGHAVYSGLGAFAVAHLLNLAAADALWVPVTLSPLLGGVAGALSGVLFGYLSTRRAGVTFAMITLGIAELVAACSLMFPGFFGGEAGITTNRVTGSSFLGISYGPQIEVYYLIAFWLFVSTAAMYGFTQTPLGRIINAVRENPERAEFIGYDPQHARYLTLILSGFFAGISGGLSAINFEIVSAENLGAIRSGTILLFTIIGGTAWFIGPMLGAVVGVFLTVVLSSHTSAWQMYLGLFFVVTVMYAPGGIAGIAHLLMRTARRKQSGRLWRWLAPALLCAATAMLGVVMMIEMLYRLALESAYGSTMKLFDVDIDAASASAWLVAAGLLALGMAGLIHAKGRLMPVWNAMHDESETETRKEAS